MKNDVFMKYENIDSKTKIRFAYVSLQPFQVEIDIADISGGRIV